jgi:hypothetical protein
MLEKIKEIKSLINYAKKFLVPDDELNARVQGYDITLKCFQVEGYDLRLFLCDNNKEKVVTMFTWYDEKSAWKEEKEYAEECFNAL